MKKLNVWLIQPGEPLPLDPNIKKMRTAHLADKLVERGHSVLWWTSAFDHFKKAWIIRRNAEMTLENGAKIFALKGTGYRKNFSLARVADHRVIALKFRRAVKTMNRPDIVVASTPPHDLAYQAVRYAKENGIPVLVDIRDEWPDLLLNVFPRRSRPLFKLFLARDFRMIREALQEADGLVAMMESLLAWGLRYAGRSRRAWDRVFYLGDVKTDAGPGRSPKLGFLDALNGKFVVTFLGTFVRNNNPSILIECAQRLKDRSIVFVLGGDGELLTEMKKRAGGLPNVFFPGWLHEEDMRALLRCSHIGVCPTNQERDAFPNKAFAYLSAGLPILSAFRGELRDIIEKRQIGFYFSYDDVVALASSIARLDEDRTLYRKMAKNAKNVFDEMFNADTIYRNYADYIEMMSNLKSEKRT
jgi:glycosyltransferase involved in cell wall biosynthesis